MTRRLALAAATAVALILLTTAPAFAGHTAAAGEPFGWDLQLRNTVSAQYSSDMTYKAFATWAASRQVTIVDNKSTVATTDDVAYKGVALKTLVGYFDDGTRPRSTRTSRPPATTSSSGHGRLPGTFPSANVASLGDKLIVASLANGEPLPVPAAPFVQQRRAPSWKPNWPLQGRQQRGQRHRRR